MKNIENMQSRIDALEFYYDRIEMPSVNVKIYGRIKDIEDVAKQLQPSQFLLDAVQKCKERESGDYSYFWESCEIDGRYAEEVIFEGVAHNSDEPEQKHIGILKQYQKKSGFFGRNGGHFCIGVSRGDLEQYIFDSEDSPEDAGEILSELSDILDAIEWGLSTVSSIAKGVPAHIEYRITEDIHQYMADSEAEAKKRATPQYKIDALREWTKTLNDGEREKVNRSIVSIEKMLIK